MSNTLYIDVDDTLIKWCPEGCTHTVHPFGKRSTHWELNKFVAKLITFWNGPIIVWSSGGEDWAREMAELSLPEKLFDKIKRFEAKWNKLPGIGDLFIDDMPLDSFRSKTIHPNDLEEFLKDL